MCHELPDGKYKLTAGHLAIADLRCKQKTDFLFQLTYEMAMLKKRYLN